MSHLTQDATFLRELFDNIADPVFVKDSKHRWVFGNASFWALLGEDAETKYCGKDDTAIFGEDEVRVFWEVDDRVALGGEVIENEETITVGGETIIARTKKSPLLLPSGDRGLVGVIRDITRERRAEEEATNLRLEAHRKSEFLATMSHELRTPLNAVLGMAQAMKWQNLPDNLVEMVDVVERSGAHLLEMITNVLDVAQGDMNRLDFNEAWFSAHALAEDLHRAHIADAERKGLDFKVEVDDFHCKGDAARIRQVLCNLVTNAIKFTRDGSIIVSMKRGADGLRIEVRDTGRGIDTESLARIFEPFHRGAEGKGELIEGAGLGLSIVDRLIRNMGGTIKVASEPQVGTTFLVTLPLETRDCDVSLGRRDFNSEPAVLCAEDDRANRNVMKALLAPITRNITFAHDGEEVVARAEEGHYDIILMDVRMPRLDGIEATRRIRRLEEIEGRAPVPIVAVTANAMVQQIAECLEAGMNHHLAKPVNGAELLKAVLDLAGHVPEAPAKKSA